MIPKAPSPSSEKTRRHSSPPGGSKKPIKPSRQATILVLFLILVSLSVVFRPYPHLPPSSIAGTSNTQLDAIVTIAMCGFPATEFVQALRGDGQWQGPIYVITDTPEQEDSTLSTQIDVRHHHPTFDKDSPPGKGLDEFQEYVQGVLEYPTLWPKWHKTQLLELLPPEHNTILFVDDDMLARKSLSKEWLPSIAPLLASRECELVINPERWYTTWPIIGGCRDAKLCGKYGGGMWIQKRGLTDKLMNEWGNALIRPPFVTQRDQGKLTDAVEATDTKICYFPSHWKHVQNGADLLDRYWFQFKSIVFRAGVFGDGENGAGAATWFHYASSKGSSDKWKDIKRGVCDLSSLTAATTLLEGNTEKEKNAADSLSSSSSSSSQQQQQRPAADLLLLL
jgi:hypothetical protein